MRLLFAILLLTLLAYAGYLGIHWVGAQYARLEPTEQAGIALLAALVLVGGSMLSGAIRYGAREQAQRGLLEQRYRVYQLTLDALQQEDISPALQSKISNSLALLGSRAVLLAYRKVQKEIAIQRVENPLIAEQLNSLTLAMRTDLGQKNFELGFELKPLLLSNPPKRSDVT